MRIDATNLNAVGRTASERVEAAKQDMVMAQKRVPDGGHGFPAGAQDGIVLPGEKRPVADDRFMKLASESANRIAKAFNMEIRFEVHEKTDIEIMQVIDAATGKVIKELPPEQILDMIAKLWETIGVFVDAKA